MANSAGDARGSELEIRKKLIQSGAVDVIVSVGSNFFYTVTLPCTLWFFDRAKARGPRKDKVLFLDARPFFKQVSRAIREFAPEQLEFLANIVRLYRGEAPSSRRAARRCSRPSGFRRGRLSPTWPGCARWRRWARSRRRGGV
jgi:type I restriction enzyme M protein